MSMGKKEKGTKKTNREHPAMMTIVNTKQGKGVNMKKKEENKQNKQEQKLHSCLPV